MVFPRKFCPGHKSWTFSWFHIRCNVACARNLEYQRRAVFFIKLRSLKTRCVGIRPPILVMWLSYHHPSAGNPQIRHCTNSTPTLSPTLWFFDPHSTLQSTHCKGCFLSLLINDVECRFVMASSGLGKVYYKLSYVCLLNIMPCLAQWLVANLSTCQ